MWSNVVHFDNEDEGDEGDFVDHHEDEYDDEDEDDDGECFYNELFLCEELPPSQIG